MGVLVPVIGDKKLICTSDGSFTFYSVSYGESYKTKSVGAYTESLHKFVKGSGILNKLKSNDVRLLDICFGIGMNLAATVDKMVSTGCLGRLHAVSVELDSNLPQLVTGTDVLFPIDGYSRLRKALNNGSCDNFSLELYICNALDLINNIRGKFDIIYFDPFSRKHNPEMWTEDVFVRLYDLLTDDGCFVTYASSKSIRGIIRAAGFKIEDIASIGARYQPALCAKKDIML